MSLLPPNATIEDNQLSNHIVNKLDIDNSIIDILPLSAKAEILPHLALMFDVNIQGLDEDEARVYIHNALEIHKYKGTVYAVKKAIDTVFERGELLEWFDRDLAAGLFDVKVTLKADHTKVYLPTKFQKAKEMIDEAKNVRSHLNSFVIDFPHGAGDIQKTEAMNFNLTLDSKINFKDVDASLSAITGAEFQFQTESKHNFNTPVVCTNQFIGGAMWQI